MNRVIIIPDFHMWCQNLASRVDYVAEVQEYMDKLVDIGLDYTSKGDKVTLLFSGDIYHRGYSSPLALVKATKQMMILSNLAEGRVYSVVGNHELSYPTLNPFWMQADIDSVYFNQLKNLPEYGTFIPLIQIVDQLVVDNCLFVFGHYGRTSYEYDYSTYDAVYFITHNPIIDTEVQSALTNELNREVNLEYCSPTTLRSAESIPITEKLKGVFVAHMHSAYSRFDVSEVINKLDLEFPLFYQGSLGRTNHREVSNSDLTRSFYVVTPETMTITSHEIQLRSRETSVKETEVVESQTKYQSTKALQRMKNSNVRTSDPLRTVREYLSTTPEQAVLFESLVNSTPITELETLINYARGLRADEY